MPSSQAVLFVQWALFSDGGLFAFGANVLHMAVIGAWGGHAVRVLIQRFVGDSDKGIVAGSIIAAWCSVMAAAALFCLEFRLSWSAAEKIDFSKVFAWMVSFHALIGVGEALITGVAISFVLNQRPELIWRTGTLARLATLNPHDQTEEAGRQTEEAGRQTEETGRSARPTIAVSITRTLAAGLVIALAIAAFLSPFASSFEDGLEAVLSKLNIAEFNLTPSVPGLFEDYEKVPVPLASWQAIAVSIAGIGGTLTVFGLALLLGKALPNGTATLTSEAAGE